MSDHLKWGYLLRSLFLLFYLNAKRSCKLSSTKYCKYNQAQYYKYCDNDGSDHSNQTTAFNRGRNIYSWWCRYGGGTSFARVDGVAEVDAAVHVQRAALQALSIITELRFINHYVDKRNERNKLRNGLKI